MPVLMYHKIHPDRPDALTVTVPQFEAQLDWLRKNRYRTVSLQQLTDAVEHNRPLPARTVLITFDDAYVNNLTYALPLLRRFDMRAAVFVPTAYLGGFNEWDGGTEPLLNPEQLREMMPVFELALHSHRHRNYKTLPLPEMEADIRENLAAFQRLDLPFIPALAYPYGGRPKDPAQKLAMQDILRKAGVGLAFRIGNRLNRFPAADRFELQRLDIRGTDSMGRFVRKIRFGKLL
ncbi:polysaccharide deacetylase family protein [Larkinella soli]|uniref:polysaccharide deacetylase family protein n=1 Tax=Larkinella soli TaxID=1770527 RepID=UPI000FFC6A0B|nr:polysaccharide deacetylase family protein [Larkinella soli]